MTLKQKKGSLLSQDPPADLPLFGLPYFKK